MQLTDVLLWYLWAQAFALAGSLVASRWLRALPDRGYGLGKPLGLLLGGFVYWMLVLLGFSLNNAGAALMALAVVWVIGIALRMMRDQASQASNVNCQGAIITAEVLFAIGFIAWVIVRAYSPDIREAGGEKFMESMMTNAIVRSASFPPNDAWLAGFSISYYYFGYLIFAMLIHLSGVAFGVAFNLAGALIFALTLTAAFSLGFNLWAARQNAERKTQNAELGDTESSAAIPHSPFRIPHSALLAGLLTATMLALMGNLGGVLGVLKCANALPKSTWQWLDVRDTATQNYACNGLAPSEFYGWWWDWSRVVKDLTPSGNYQETITESPIFSFVLGDNHPHVNALPFLMLALGLAVTALIDRRFLMNDDSKIEAPQVASTVLTAIVLGGLSFMNTWDFPIFGTLFIGALVFGRWLRRESVWPALLQGAGIMALGYLLYLPFYITFASQARGIGVNIFNGTRFTQFFLMFAPFLIAMCGFVWLQLRNAKLPARVVLARSAGLTVGLVVAGLIGALLFGVLSSETRALAAELNATGNVLGITREMVSSRLIERATDPWTILFLAFTIASCAVLLLLSKRDDAITHSTSSEQTLSPLLTFSSSPFSHTAALNGFALLLFGAGAILTLAVEFVFLRDLFGTRMNTVFKFYYQAWVLWAVAGGFAIMSLLAAHSKLMKIVGGLALLFVAMGLLWPALAVPARADQFRGKPTLDGAAWLQIGNPEDAQMIAWLNENVKGDPVIVEASTLGAYQYEGRISAFTGLPAVLGWGGHQHQWRGDITEAARRNPMVEQLYNTADLIEARALLDALKARYVIVGQLERQRFAAEGVAKFESLCRVAFKAGGSAIYDCAVQ
jgi:YYY domain-containing protein